MPTASDVKPSLGVTGPSMAGRAALALLLMVGFYVLAITIAVALLAVCYVMIAYGHRVYVKLVVLCVAGAGMILWSIIPRVDRFVPPGPRLTPDRQPKLFAEIASIAAATGQAPPDEVYLEPDVNAWVAQRGGVMGIGGRRVMGIGLGLMRVLGVDEFRAVLAHEFGHFHGGDTKLGPWVYKTRAAIGRTINNLGGGALQRPFVAYGNLFLRITHAVSRRQEYTADRLAATVAGAAAMISGLRKVHGTAMAYTPFWRTEVVPLLSAGHRPPLADGFARFLQSPAIVAAVDGAVQKQMTDAAPNPYDTHPPLKDRVAALQDLAAHPASGTPADVPAISLLDDVPRLEHELLATFVRPEVMNKLVETRWEDAATAVYVPSWRQAVSDSQSLLAGLTPETLPDHPLLAALHTAGNRITEQQQRQAMAVGSAIALAAMNAGGTLECELGSPIVVVRDGTRAEPFSVVGALVKQEMDRAAWRRQCDALGITGVDLSKTTS